MGFHTSNALVLREVRYKEADRILTLFTPEDGIVTANARGALRKSSRITAATQQLTYSEMNFFENKGRLIVNEAVVKEPFDGLRANFENYALGCYFAECTEAIVQEGSPEPAALQLILNSLYALSHELYPPEKIKAAFELRLMCITGYEPDLSACCVCGREKPSQPVIGTRTGHICCRECRNAEVGITNYLCDASLEAMRYIASAPPKQLFSFNAEEDAGKWLSDACENYFIEHAERRFSTLDYWKKLKY